MTRTRTIVALLCALAGANGLAAEVNVVGLFPNKALLEIDKSKAKLVSVGQTVGGVKLLSVDNDSAQVLIDGKRETIQLGQSTARAQNSSIGQPSVVLTADSRGHFITTGTINGATTTFMVDTGATSIALDVAEAKRLGLNYTAGQKGLGRTASGIVVMYAFQLDTVRVGDITLHQVDAAVLEGAGIGQTLLGMSFLKRLDMKRQGTTLTLTKSY